MPIAPRSHKRNQIGKSHTAEVNKNKVNYLAYQRQKKRQYKTNSSIWRGIRADQLRREPLCAHCREKGKTRSATHVDHKDGDSWNNNPGNLQSLCHQCHSRKTVLFDGGFGNERRTE